MAVQYTLTPITWSQLGVTGNVTATITAPDGTTQQVQATNGLLQNAGACTAWFTPQQSGTHQIAWASTGGQATTATLVVDAAPAPVPVMSLADCYGSLKLDPKLEGTNPARDADMLAYAAAAAQVIEGFVGPISPQTITETFDGWGQTIALRARPTSIVSLTQNGTPLSGWVVDFPAGIIYAGQGPIWWLPGIRNVEVIYTAGSGNVKPNVLLGIREVFRQMWERSRALGGAATPDSVRVGFAVPSAVLEMIAVEHTMPGFA